MKLVDNVESLSLESRLGLVRRRRRRNVLRQLAVGPLVAVAISIAGLGAISAIAALR
jgi:hypothetical protein